MRKTATSGVLTARDLEISVWLGRLPGASIEQIRRRFELGRTQGYRRLQVLISFGLVRRLHLLAERPALYTVNGRSLRPGSYEHALALAELIVAREGENAVIATDQELRRQRGGRSALNGLFGPGELDVIGRCDRIPDAVESLTGGGLVAYEIELSSKGRTRRESVLSAYATSGYRQVRWVVPNAVLARLIGEEVERVGLDGFMEVERGLDVGA
ncbi:MAG: hypothetical protein ACR2G3_05245 [Solirubrobacterales bacterium]